VVSVEICSKFKMWDLKKELIAVVLAVVAFVMTMMMIMMIIG